jgi:hypothetical protein
MNEQSEYQKLKHSYTGNYQPVRRPARDWSGCGAMALAITINLVAVWLLWLAYEYIFPPMGAPHIPLLVFWGLVVLLRLVFSGRRH